LQIGRHHEARLGFHLLKLLPREVDVSAIAAEVTRQRRCGARQGSRPIV
jgi:hypothetical protein